MPRMPSVVGSGTDAGGVVASVSKLRTAKPGATSDASSDMVCPRKSKKIVVAAESGRPSSRN